MLINLKSFANQGEQHLTIELTERLPDHIIAPCRLNCDYTVLQQDNFYLLNIHVHGMITMTCQRCLHEFDSQYDNQTEIAACLTDERAEELMAGYECVVAVQGQLDLSDLIADELFLYSTQKHADIKACDRSIDAYIKPEDHF